MCKVQKHNAVPHVVIKMKYLHVLREKYWKITCFCYQLNVGPGLNCFCTQHRNKYNWYKTRIAVSKFIQKSIFCHEQNSQKEEDDFLCSYLFGTPPPLTQAHPQFQMWYLYLYLYLCFYSRVQMGAASMLGSSLGKEEWEGFSYLSKIILAFFSHYLSIFVTNNFIILLL